MQKLLKEAPKWKNGEIPNLDHDTAYDFVKYDLPKVLSYIRTLEKEHREMREALEGMVDWFDELQKEQWEKTSKGLADACENWNKE